MKESRESSPDVLFVNPSQARVYHPGLESAAYPAFEPPYLAALTAEFIRKRGYGVDILDANVLGLSPEQAARRISETNPGLTHIIVHGNQPSASSQLMDWVSDVCTNVKASGSNTKILLSGTHPAALPQRTLEEEACDFVGRGDGFRTVESLLRGAPNNQVPGLWFKENGRAVQGLPSKLMSSQELGRELPKAAWDLLPVKDYRAHDWHSLENLDARQPYAAIYTSFGCPFECNFCCINAPFNEEGTQNNVIRFRDPTDVADEIEFLVREKGVRNIKIIDEMFVLDKRHYMGIANQLIQRGLGDKLNIWAYARVDTIRESTLETLRSAGIRWFALGIESASAHVRDGIEKGRFGHEQIAKNVATVQNAGIYVIGNFIFGLPDDTRETMEDTLALAQDLNCERPNFYCAMAYPGSELHRMAQNTSQMLRQSSSKTVYHKGSLTVLDGSQFLPVPSDWNPRRALLPEDNGGPGWIGYSQHAYETWPLPTANLHPAEIVAFRDQALSRYFNDPRYSAMLSNKFGKSNSERFIRVNSKAPSKRLVSEVK